MSLNEDEAAILDALCMGLRKREIVSALRLTSNLYDARMECAREKSDSATNFELVSKYTVWKITQGR